MSREPRIDGCEDWPMPFGKHKGLRLADLPYDYLEWCVDNLNCDQELYAALCKVYADKKARR